MPLKKTTSHSVETQKPELKIVRWYLDSECSKHMTGNRSQLMNFVSKFLGTVRIENDQIAKIMGYGDYQLRNVTISMLSHLNFAYALGKSKKSSHQPKAEDTNQEKLYLLHMNLCGMMRVESINGKKTQASINDSWNIKQPCIPPKRNDWDHLFQPMFDEYFNPPTSDVSPVQVAATPTAVDIAFSTTF
ncbi:hypothetical protein Tco_0216109 [Tanacetum coccineum]